MNIKIYVFVFFLFISSIAIAEERVEFEDVVITASRIGELIGETVSSVTVIKGDEIREKNVIFVTDILRELPELNLVQNGGPGRNATVFLRGGGSEHVLVMIDGVKVNSPTTGTFDFSGINVDDIDRIEIVKGPQSTIYGSEAMAGVINIITKKGKVKPEINASLESGSFGTYKPSLTFTGGAERLDYRVTMTYFYTDGISAAKSGIERDGYKNATISGKFGFRPSERIELDLSGRYYYDRSELDGFDYMARQAIDDLNYLQHGLHFIISGKGKLYLSDRWEQVLMVSTVKDSLRSRDPDTDYNNYDIITTMSSIDYQHNLDITDIYTLTAGIEYRKEKGENKGNFEGSVDNKAAYLNNKLRPLGESLIINAGLRYEDHEIFGSKTTYRIGAVYQIKSLSLRIRGSYGTGFRAPSLNELFYPFYGNPDLRPEETTAWEIGVEKDIIKEVSLSIAYFDQRYKNLIQTDPATWTAANIAKAEIKGVEIGAGFKILDSINIKCGYTHLDAKDSVTGERLSRRPENKLGMSAGFNMKDLTLNIDYIFVGDRYDSSVKRDLPDYSLVNLSGSYSMTKGMAIFARFENLFDKKYEEAGSYGTPGFSAFGGIRMSL